MEKIEVGQIIYVETKAMFSSNTPALSEYQVIKVNTKSIYAVKLGTDYVLRLDKRTMMQDDGMGFLYKAYLKEEDYWNMIKEKEQKERLKKRIVDSLSSLSIDKLIEINEIACNQ